MLWSLVWCLMCFGRAAAGVFVLSCCVFAVVYPNSYTDINTYGYVHIPMRT